MNKSYDEILGVCNRLMADVRANAHVAKQPLTRIIFEDLNGVMRRRQTE